MNTVLSYTLLNTWTICPHQCYRRYIAKDIPYEETPEMKWGNDVHSAMECRIAHKKPLPDSMKQWEPLVAPLDRKSLKPEQRLGITSDGHGCDFFARNVWLRGKIDVPIVNGEVAMILDWKTGKVREDSFELEIGALLLKARRPRLNTIIGRYVWLRDGKLGEEHDCSDTERTWNSVQRIAREIETTWWEAKDNDAYEKTPGPLCAWCAVTDCEHNRREK
jgi:hypothetical protein